MSMQVNMICPVYSDHFDFLHQCKQVLLDSEQSQKATNPGDAGEGVEMWHGHSEEFKLGREGPGQSGPAPSPTCVPSNQYPSLQLPQDIRTRNAFWLCIFGDIIMPFLPNDGKQKRNRSSSKAKANKLSVHHFMQEQWLDNSINILMCFLRPRPSGAMLPSKHSGLAKIFMKTSATPTPVITDDLHQALSSQKSLILPCLQRNHDLFLQTRPTHEEVCRCSHLSAIRRFGFLLRKLLHIDKLQNEGYNFTGSWDDVCAGLEAIRSDRQKRGLSVDDLHLRVPRRTLPSDTGSFSASDRMAVRGMCFLC